MDSVLHESELALGLAWIQYRTFDFSVEEMGRSGFGTSMKVS